MEEPTRAAPIVACDELKTMAEGHEKQLCDSWEANAGAWTAMVREGRIESRRAGTDQAIVDQLASLAKGTLLDVGCGEGWLSRAASGQGWRVTGVDASTELIRRANELGGARFLVCAYRSLCRDLPEKGIFDCIVCNFSLLDDKLDDLLRCFRHVMAKKGTLLIQTVHPGVAAGAEGYRDGWREETFQNWSGEFAAVMPWYFRTLSSWHESLRKAGFPVSELKEPRHPESGRVLSLLLVCAAADD